MTNDLTKKLICGAGAAVLTLLTTTSVQAAPVPARQVSYADLNLHADAGRATLATRVRAAAEAVCATGGQSYREVAASKKCVEDAVSAAMTKAASIS